MADRNTLEEMSTPSYDVKTFKKILKEETQRIAEEKGWKYGDNTYRGYTFQLWLAGQIANYEQSFETEPEEALLYSKDLKADLVFEDSTNKQMLICQCKFSGFSKKFAPVNEDEVVSFFERHDLFQKQEWVQKHGSQDAIEALADYKEKLEKDGYSVEYRFVTTGEASTRIKELVDKKNEEFIAKDISVKCELLDFHGIKEYYERAQSLEDSIPEEVRIPFPLGIEKGGYILKEEPYRTIILLLKGSIICDWYKHFKESLFAYNIRGYLGNRGINSQIRETARGDPERFLYYNNGVSAICKRFDFEERNEELVAYGFQIINGAQTIGALGKSDPNSQVCVLFRLTETEKVKGEGSFKQHIIEYNNKQNLIKVSDFRANDQIQKWLERRFAEQKPKGNLPNLYYICKRGQKRSPGQKRIKLEELAKVRYSFTIEPTRVHSQPRSLWTDKDDGGVYEQAFGIDGKIQGSWTDESFQECLLALCFYFRFDKEAKALANKDPKFKYLKGLKWHALSLAGVYYQRMIVNNSSIKKIVETKARFDDEWKKYWALAFDILDDTYIRAIEYEKMTRFNFVRNIERWNRMKDSMERKIIAKYL